MTTVRRNSGCMAALRVAPTSMQVQKSLLTITHSEALAMAQVLLFGRSDNRG